MRPGTTQPLKESVCLSGSFSLRGCLRRTGVGALGGARSGLLRAMGAGDGAFGPFYPGKSKKDSLEDKGLVKAPGEPSKS